MAVFSTNQTRQLYVVTNDGELKTPKVLSTDKVGSISVHADDTKNHLYFSYVGAGGITRSDLIDIKNIISAKATNADSMTHTLKAVSVKLSDEVNNGNPIAGQDYLLRVILKQFVGMSDADQYVKYGAVHATAKMDASEFYAQLAISLAKNFSRETTKLVSIHLESDGGSEEILPNGYTSEGEKVDAKSTVYTGVIIEEVAQPWVLGKVSQEPVCFEVYPTTVLLEGDEVVWGVAAELDNSANADAKVTNGTKIADLEYFCMGERGDIYRGAGYPNDITTTYLVDPNLKYSTIDIHYAYVGSNESVQKSEKTITIAVPVAGENNNGKIDSIITAINTATGLSIAKLTPGA